VAFLVVKVLYVGAVWAVPYFVGYLVRPFEEALGTPLGRWHVSRVWLVALILLTVLTALLAARYVNEVTRAFGRMEREAVERLALRRLLLAWLLLDSISFYGVVSKVLLYADLWCYGFVAVSTALTIAAGRPLWTLRRGESR
jgi:uncharacterized membrane protein (DUF485 family)